MVTARPSLASLEQLRFRDPECFKAGELHNYLSVWENLLRDIGNPKVDLLDIIREGVRIERFFRPFKGNFKGRTFNSSVPPPMRLKNSKSCDPFLGFISDTLIDWVAAGVLSIWGKAGEVEPPHLTLPITIEPSKPRLCHDERFLNLWIIDLPFRLDHLPDLPRYVLPGHFQTTFDEKSGYQHVLLHPSSRSYFGLEFKGVYFVFRTLPFGWKASAYVYHNIGLAVTSAARSFGVPVSQYIDDRHVGQLFSPSHARNGLPPDPVLAVAGAYILCYLLIEAGYFINIEKACYVPSTSVRFLGFTCDSAQQAFLLPEDKKQKFASLREGILSSRCIDVRTLQRFAGKVISFSLAVPGCKLYIREVFKAISRLGRNSKPSMPIDEALRDEITFWRFLDNWTECLPWRSERHLSVSLFSDASLTAWGAVLKKDGHELSSRDYWPAETNEDISVLEARALLNALVAFKGQVSNARIDVHVDNLILKSALDNDGCRNSAVNTIVKRILECSREGNFSVHAFYVPSKDNPADAPSRKWSEADCMLSPEAWSSVERFFGPHTFDLMSLDSNCQRDRSGAPLPHFTPCFTPGSSGVNVFSNCLPSGHNIYIFPPFVLIGPLLRYVIDQEYHGAFTLIVPDLRPRQFWWATLQAFVVDRLLLGRKGSPSVLLFPSNSTPWLPRPLQWDLWALRCIC